MLPVRDYMGRTMPSIHHPLPLATLLLACVATTARADSIFHDPEETDPLKLPQLIISELVTDPQADHGESSGGNGVAFDSMAIRPAA